MRIADVRVTPIAFRDPPLLNVQGVHEPWALRSIIEVETDGRRIGLGESYGDLATLTALQRIAPSTMSASRTLGRSSRHRMCRRLCPLARAAVT